MIVIVVGQLETVADVSCLVAGTGVRRNRSYFIVDFSLATAVAVIPPHFAESDHLIVLNSDNNMMGYVSSRSI